MSHFNRVRFSRRTAVSLGIAAMIGACATGGSNTTHLHEMNVQVKNNLAVPTALTIYAVNANGSRRLGDVLANDSVLLKWIPPDNGGSYRLIAERPLERPIRSQPFSVGTNIGTITWMLVPNILSFREPDVIDTVHVDSASAR